MRIGVRIAGVLSAIAVFSVENVQLWAATKVPPVAARLFAVRGTKRSVARCQPLGTCEELAWLHRELPGRVFLKIGSVSCGVKVVGPRARPRTQRGRHSLSRKAPLSSIRARSLHQAGLNPCALAAEKLEPGCRNRHA